jgi:putative component of membrane protein insertase Oxa1/YidC/SpoIIIJ protein YidD
MRRSRPTYREVFLFRKVADKLSAVSRGVTTPIVCVVYLFVRLLMWIAPDAEHLRRIKAERAVKVGVPPVVVGRPNPVVAVVVALYRHSWVRTYMHRNGERCCFVPSCSEYSLLAVQRYGFWRGLLLIGDRFRRCTPLYSGEYVDFP